MKTETERFCALLVESLDDEYEAQVLGGTLLGARETDLRILCVAGGVVDDPDPERRAMNFAFDLIGPRNTKGVIALSSAIGSAIGPTGLQEWLRRYDGLPTCCLGVQVPGHSHIGVDNYRGNLALVRHLIEAHEARRMVFIRGPQDSPEAEDRYRAFCDALEGAGLELDESLVVTGDYSKESGQRAIVELIDERGVLFREVDTVVAANDYMAQGALLELEGRRVRVPEDVRLAGFDDVDSARLSRPPLTTVRQPIETLGRKAVGLLSRVTAGSIPAPEIMGTELVVRRSCGCQAVDLGLLSHESERPSQSTGASLVVRRQLILATLMRAARGALGSVGQGWENRLLDTLVQQLEGRPGGTLALRVDHLLGRWDPESVEGAVIQDVLSVLRREVLTCVGDDHASRARLEAAIHEARVAAALGVGEIIESKLKGQAALFDRFEHAAHRAMFRDSAQWGPILQPPLAALGVEACVVAALDRPGEVAGEASVLFAVGAGPPRFGEKMVLWALPQHRSLHRMGRALLLLPLSVDEIPRGAAVMAVNRIDGALVEGLRAWFSTLVCVAALLPRDVKTSPSGQDAGAGGSAGRR